MASLMKNAKNTVKLGIVSGVGMGVMGAMGAPAGLTNTVGAGLNIANIGQMGKTGMDVAGMFSDKKSKNCMKKGKHVHNRVISNMI